MRYLYFDLISGISGDMIVASLSGLANNFDYLKKELKKINLREYEIRHFRAKSGHIKAYRFAVKDLARNKRVFQFDALRNKIRGSGLKQEIKNRILDVYETLYQAEKKVHGTGHVHFQQIGEVDSIIDITSACILIDKLNIDSILYSSIPFGRKVAPATANMLKLQDIYLTDHGYENITPTGIAIITTLGSQAQRNIQHDFNLKDVGYGAGSIRSADSPNVLRVVLFRSKEAALFESDEIVVMQCNIDDMNAQVLGFLMDKLYSAGALEVYFENFYTKKSRLGVLISVLSKYETFDTISDIIFRETTTLGLRFFKANRIKLKRKERLLSTAMGKVRIKEAGYNRYKKVIPEYEDCVRIAKLKNIPLREILEKIKSKASEGK